MDKEKAVEEMARTMCIHLNPVMQGKPCSECETHDKNCYMIIKARRLYNAGYRKADEVRKETAREILTTLMKLLNRETPLAADIQELAEIYGVEVEG